ncbi:MAG: DUF4383 domain-containing protein [Chlamydiales bacterium]|nr:DUF4383 domain-containing protein [Chlamydiales bacterium]
MRFWAVIFAVVFLIFGFLGFNSNWLIDGKLFGLFVVNLWLNILYLFVGGFAVLICFTSRNSMRLYFQVVGIIFGLIAIGGFILLDREMLFFLANNSNNTWFSVCVAVIALILGFSVGAKKTS